jgi:DNA polymerase-4
MPLAQARKLCPHGIYLRGNHAAYREASNKVREVLDSVSPLVQMASIDEAYIDITGSLRLFGGDDAIGVYVKGEIRNRTGLPCTIAIAPNKLVAKVGSDYAKPDGYLRIDGGSEEKFLAPLPVRKLPGAGPRTCQLLESLGVMTVGQLAKIPLPLLERVLGDQAVVLQRAAHGIGSSVVEVDRLPKSISRETTFEQDLLDWSRLEQVLAFLTEKCMYALREDRLETRRVTLKVRYADFQTNTFAKTLAEPTCIDADITTALRALLPKARERRARVRLIGVNLSMLSHNQHQLGLFTTVQNEKWERVLEQVDGVKGRLGFESIRFGKALEKESPKSDAAPTVAGQLSRTRRREIP